MLSSDWHNKQNKILVLWVGIYILLLQSIHILQSIQKVVFKHLSLLNLPTQSQSCTIPVCQQLIQNMHLSRQYDLAICLLSEMSAVLFVHCVIL